MKKVLIIISCLFLLCGCKKKMDLSYTPEQEELKIEILSNFQGVVESSNIASSDLDDYTGNGYYDNLVNMGTKIIPVLEKMHYNGELKGVTDPLSGKVIEDITNCNLAIKYNHQWYTAEEFYKFYKEHNCNEK